MFSALTVLLQHDYYRRQGNCCRQPPEWSGHSAPQQSNADDAMGTEIHQVAKPSDAVVTGGSRFSDASATQQIAAMEVEAGGASVVEVCLCPLLVYCLSRFLCG